MKRIVIALALVMGLPLAAQAQTHPCDITPTVLDVPVGTPYAVGVCHDLKDTNGATIVITGWKMILDGAAAVPITLTKGATANTKGQWYFESAKTLTAPAAGLHTITLIAMDDKGDSAPSDPFTFTSSTGVPSKPVNGTGRVIR